MRLRATTIDIPDWSRQAAPDAVLRAPGLGHLLDGLPAGTQVFWGVPFSLAPATVIARFVWFGPGGRPDLAIQLSGRATYILVAHFSIPTGFGVSSDEVEGRTGGVMNPGEVLANYTLVYADGTENRSVIRRRFEINDVVVSWGELAFVARHHQEPRPVDWRSTAGQWGFNQQGLDGPELGFPEPYELSFHEYPHYWIYSLANPKPDTDLASLRIDASNAGVIAIAGLTLWDGPNPLVRRRCETLQIDVSPVINEPVEASIDTGIIVHQEGLTELSAEQWLSGLAGCGSSPRESTEGRIVVDVTSSDAATLTVDGAQVSMSEVFTQGRALADAGRVRVELLTPSRHWVNVIVVDAMTGSEISSRVHFRASDGRYLPPYGHRRDVNDRWFEDYSADLKLGGMSYAYVKGQFQIELPVGEVYVEISKGFEYEPLRARLEIAPNQRELTLSLRRIVDWRSRGWVTADTHVHFISPQTAILEAEAEGVNIVNLLAAQWGDLFTNVSDLSSEREVASGHDTVVWTGTENRQHMLGHLSLLGTRRPVVPFSAGGPWESSIGDPVWSSLSEWADECRQADGIVISPHFPEPYCELVADVILGKIDAVELRDFMSGVDSYGVREYYRLLNCGYRIAAVGGTDKMSAGMPVGGVRTYALLEGSELSFASWADSVRSGKTFTSSGPLIDLNVEGQHIGGSIVIPRGGGHLTVEARSESIFPLNELEIVYNGQVVARESRIARSLHIQTSVHIDRSGWIVARSAGPTILWHVWPIRTVAHTSPVYISNGSSVPNATDLAYLNTILDGGLAWLGGLATKADPERHARIERVFQDAKHHLGLN
jgi:hypothetical protein